MHTGQLLGNDESAIAVTGSPVIVLESDVRALIENCIAANKTNSPPGNPGPFDRGYRVQVRIPEL